MIEEIELGNLHNNPNKTICQVFYRLHYSDSFIDF